MWAKHKQPGFTIVELLIVIVIIGILAAITVVAYNGIQAKARDARIRDAAVKVAQAVQILAVNQQQTPTMPGWGTSTPVSNGSCTGGSGGWAGTTAYSCTLEDMLFSTKLLPANFMLSLPPNKNHGDTTGVSTMMYYPCYAGTNQALLLYYIENPTADDSSNLNANMSYCGLGTELRDTYGMRASQIIRF